MDLFKNILTNMGDNVNEHPTVCHYFVPNDSSHIVAYYSYMEVFLKCGYPKIILSLDSLDHDFVLKQPWWRLGIPYDLRNPQIVIDSHR